ncbi:MAG TPA: crosslink repair DNA glycosylase YcaQ family protein [Tahibacter sp.]|uniref:winged helix-turn-helix domain-containing protein n=1 Tax=Tahibacter sp. TaxID=2056211 RepID=UPI002C47103A|nr:crosslink repair DNA glycosylase YcaQ family protein [Tahibacter sp.]HSX62178.1 crosslink repair DNA glycosylase YcaQ family protein [Tahibacter sp.]
MTSDAASLTLSESQARLLHLAAQGLLLAPRAKATPARLLAAVARMQLLQIDTIHVVARSPYLTLFSRLGAYPAEWLEKSLSRGALFETWAHEACFAPMADFDLHRDFRPARAGHWALRHAARVRGTNRDETDALLAHVTARGAVRSADFERTDTQPGGGWWGWKSEKRWLEALFGTGELMVARRENFQRVYDLSERVLKAAQRHRVERETQPPEAVKREWIARSVKALGVTPARWIADYFRLGRQVAAEELAPLLDSGQIVAVRVTGWDKPAYVHADHLALARRAAAGGLRATHSTLLSPFDPVVWDRARAAALFGFDYRLECYTPEPRRRYGYFVLPLLRRGRLVGRLDAKAHRREGRFEVKALYLEDGVVPDDALAGDLALALRQCADWHETPHVTLGRCEPRAFAAALRRALRVLDEQA